MQIPLHGKSASSKIRRGGSRSAWIRVCELAVGSNRPILFKEHRSQKAHDSHARAKDLPGGIEREALRARAEITSHLLDWLKPDRAAVITKEQLHRAIMSGACDASGVGNEFYDTDIAFHAILYQTPGNPIYPAVHKAYVEWLIQHWRSMRTSAELDRMNYVGHLSVFQAIAARNPDEAEDALRRHLAAAWELIRSAAFPEHDIEKP